jgi:hypothetical protein
MKVVEMYTCREGTGGKSFYRMSHGQGRKNDLDMLLDVEQYLPGLNAPFSNYYLSLGPSAVCVVSLNKFFAMKLRNVSKPKMVDEEANIYRLKIQ